MADVWANSMACHFRATHHIAGCCHLVNSLSCSQSHATFQGAVIWRNQCHDRATLQGVKIPPAILKIVFRHIIFFIVFLNAVWALTSSGFRIVSNTLVSHGRHTDGGFNLNGFLGEFGRTHECDYSSSRPPKAHLCVTCVNPRLLSSGMLVYSGNFFPKYADLSSLKYARKICGKYAKYAAIACSL